jgi:hypothetical protein
MPAVFLLGAPSKDIDEVVATNLANSVIAFVTPGPIVDGRMVDGEDGRWMLT